MDIKEEKIALAKRVLDTDDEGILQNIKAVLNGVDNDWWNELSEEAKSSIEKGLKESEDRNLITHEEAMKNYK